MSTKDKDLSVIEKDNAEELRTTLLQGEAHPAAKSALNYLAALPYTGLMLYLESYASCAIEGNRLGEICAGTLNRLLTKKPVSDRYLLGLAWSIRSMESHSNKCDAAVYKDALEKIYETVLSDELEDAGSDIHENKSLDALRDTCARVAGKALDKPQNKKET